VVIRARIAEGKIALNDWVTRSATFTATERRRVTDEQGPHQPQMRLRDSD